MHPAAMPAACGQTNPENQLATNSPPCDKPAVNCLGLQRGAKPIGYAAAEPLRDAWNRLAEVKSGANVVGKYEYDGLNRRIKKHIDTQAPAEPNGVDTYRHFYYNISWQIVETRKSTSENTEPEATLEPEYQYVWSLRYIDAAVLRDKNDLDSDDIDKRLVYSCNCGWIDWTHATKSMPMFWSTLRYANPNIAQKKFVNDKVGYRLRARMEHGKWGIHTGVNQDYWIEYDLSLEKRQSIALSILKKLAWALETFQANPPYGLFTDSGFSEEDLTSDLLGFYMTVLGKSKDKIKDECICLSKPDSA